MRTLIAVALTFALVAPSHARETKEITLGQVGLSFYAVVGGVVHELLERDGYTVTVVEGSHADIFPKLGAGEVDMLAAAWLPGGHAALYEPVRDVTFQIAPLYEGARFFWVVPSYVPASDVASIADLAKPDVKTKMAQRIVSLPEATGLTQGARRVMDEYGLAEAGYELAAAPPAEWLGTFRTAVEEKRWLVFPLWQPHWVNATYDVRRLDEPKNAYGAPDVAYLLGHTRLKDKLEPATLGVLSAIRFSIEDVTEMDRAVNVDGASPRDAARAWMSANADAVAAWSKAAADK